MSVEQPDDAVVELLTTPLAGWTILVGPLRSTPATKAVFVLASGGLAPEPQVGGGDDLYTSTVQVFLRSDDDGTAYVDALEAARVAIKTLQRATSEGYVSITVQQSQPYFLQESSAGIFEFLVLAELQHMGPITT